MNKYAYNPSGWGTKYFNSGIWEIQYSKAADIISTKYAHLKTGTSHHKSFVVKFDIDTPIREQYRVLHAANIIFEINGVYELEIWCQCGNEDHYLGDGDDPLEEPKVAPAMLDS